MPRKPPAKKPATKPKARAAKPAKVEPEAPEWAALKAAQKAVRGPLRAISAPPVGTRAQASAYSALADDLEAIAKLARAAAELTESFSA